MLFKSLMGVLETVLLDRPNKEYSPRADDEFGEGILGNQK
jgi:hypothetical protein